LNDLYENVLFQGYKVRSRSCYGTSKDEDGLIARDKATLVCKSINRFEPDKELEVEFEVWDRDLGEK